MRVALVHDWLVSNRGGEKVLDALVELFPKAEIFTLLYKRGTVSARIEDRPIHTSFLQQIPGIFERYRHFLPLMPAAIASFNLDGFDLVVSSSHCVAKGVCVPKGTPHLAYVHAPMRYMWDLFEDYFGPKRAPLPVRLAAMAVRPGLRAWDRRTARRPDRLVANSQNISRKIFKHWGRPSEVVYPPVELDRFLHAPPVRSDERSYFLWVGAFAPYKRADLAIEAFRRFGEPLWIAGEGQEAKKLGRHLPANVKFLGRVGDEQLPELYRNARALVFPGEEDFGITPLEAQASGTPVLALARGGALETLTPETAVFFSEQTEEALASALREFVPFEKRFDPQKARDNARRFHRTAFLKEISRQVNALLTAAGSIT